MGDLIGKRGEAGELRGIAPISTDAPGAGSGPSAWSPLRRPVFRALWIATVVSNIGTWMHDVGSAWLMTSLDTSPLLVALLQTAASLPIFFLAVPAGALADIVDRRRLLLATQLWMFGVAAVMGGLTLMGVTSPWLLLALTFALGLGAALNAPAWQSVPAEVVSREELPAAAGLGGIGVNIARAVGPALAGIVVAAAGPAAVFLINAASYSAILFVLYRWERESEPSIAPAERFVGAMRAGGRYARYAVAFRAVLVRTAAAIVFASAVWALLPVVGRNELALSALQYGLLLGCLGSGAVGGAFVLPRLRRNFSVDRVVAGASLVWAGAALAHVRVYPLLCLFLVIGGMAWLALMSSLNAAALTGVPGWVRARGLAFYLLVFQGGMALGSVVWGIAAERVGTSNALSLAAAGMVLALLAGFRFKLSAVEGLNLVPSLHWPDPVVAAMPYPDEGPVLVLIEYRVAAERSAEFAKAMRELEAARRRDGAFQWGLFQDVAEHDRWVEEFMVESWAEHLRQHGRVTESDRVAEERVRAFHRLEAPPVVTHLIAGRDRAPVPESDGKSG
jgi:MFS family permease